MLMLATTEIVFWGWMERRIMSDHVQYRAVFVATMLLVVFLYSPLRSWIARLQAKALGRSRPSAELAVESLLDRANLLSDPRKGLEQTLEWALRTESLRWIRPGAGRERTLQGLSETHGCLGQELSDTIGSEAASRGVPVKEGGKTSALVLGPSDGRGWRRGDLELARLVARAAEPLLESHGLKQEREALQREMHDGLGNQLYGLTLLSQDCEEVPLDKLLGRMERIQSTAQDAIDSLRTGLSVLSAPTGSFGPALGKLSLRSEGHLAGAGIRLESWVEDEVTELELDGLHAFAFLRTIQEGLGNAARHSQAKVVQVQVGLPEGKLLASSTTTAKDSIRKSSRRGLGLGHIHRRLFELGGSGAVVSIPGEGTRVRLEMPLPDREVS
jgi:signal transduction histidine kinase